MALRFCDHGTKEMLGVNLDGLKLDKSQTLRHNSKRYTTKLGDAGQQYCVCLHGA